MAERYYDRAGNSMTLQDWSTKHSDYDYKVVVKTEVGDAKVSTVWLGLNHNFGSGEPLIFETMVFGGEYDQHRWRYSTEESAREDHDRIVAALRVGDDPYEDKD